MSNWYVQTGKESDVVIASKVRLARNLSQFNFNIKDEQEIQKLENLIEENLVQIGYGLRFVKLRDLDKVSVYTLFEKGLITEEMAKNKQRASILINDDESICILINDEDHLRIQVYATGLELEAIKNLCVEIDEKLQTIFTISKSQKYGYLTACPTNVGTGMKMTVILHLPCLTKTNNMRKATKFVRQFGIEITKEQNPDIYKISNERTLGITEEDIVKSLKVITEKLIEQERLARKILTENQLDLEDSIYRSYGILTNCKRISQNESEELLSNIKLGTDLGIIQELTDSKVKKIYLYVKQANLSKYFGQDLNCNDEKIKRAEVIKQIIKE